MGTRQNRLRGGSNEYPQSMFKSKNKKKVHLCTPHYIKVGCKGNRSHGHVILMHRRFDSVTSHGVQRRMISVVIFFVFLRLLFFALLLLYVT